MSSSPRSSLLAAVVVVASAAGLYAAPAQAQWSSASVFTDDGVEIGVEPRLFALFALLNAAGYDKETVFGPQPLEVPAFSETRRSLRDNLGRSSPTDFLAVLKKHPASLEAYMSAALELGPAPRFDPAAAKSPIAKDLGPVLRAWFNEEGGSSLLRNANDAARDEQKKLLPIVDKAVKATNKIVRVGDATDALLDDDVGATGRVAIVLNDLDAHGTLRVLQAGDTTGVIRGPVATDAQRDAAIDAALLAYAKNAVQGEVGKLDPAGTLLTTFDAVGPEVKKTFKDNKAWGTALMACAVAREVRARGLDCAAVNDDHSVKMLALIAPRLKTFAATTALFSAGLPDMMAEPPPAEPAPEGEAAPAPPAPPTKGKK